MSTSDSDYKLLWGRAAGRCSNPACREDLTVILEAPESYNIGEMAHIIAKQPGGPRGVPEGGSDGYANLILLCPTCHRRVDKAPEGEYPEDLLHEWKHAHEAEVRKIGSAESFRSTAELKAAVRRVLAENRILWSELGPRSDTARSDPGSNLHILWGLRKLDTILPNNRKIVNLVEANAALVHEEEYREFLRFKAHALAFESHQYEPIDSYPAFPESFEKAFSA